MSGGYFDYIQHRFDYDLIEPLMHVIESNNELPYPDADNEWDKHLNQEFIDNGCKRFSDGTIDEFKKGLDIIRKAAVYIQRIDYLLCGDDDEETFHERLVEDLDKIKN